MNKNKLPHFDNSDVFFELEELAIDGQLDYDDYPPEEYRYFSKLSRLGYMNRHKGWSKEICEQKQEEYRAEYRDSCAIRSGYVLHRKELQDKLIRSSELSRQLNTAADRRDVTDIALDLLENLLEEPGLKQRVLNKLKGDSNEANMD